MRPLLILPLILATPAIAQPAPPAVNYGAPGGQVVAPAAVAVPIQQITYPVQVPTTAAPAAQGSRCVVTGYGQQTTGVGSFGGLYTVGGSVSCPL